MGNKDRQTRFKFKQFEVSNCRAAMKVGTDGVLLGAWASQCDGLWVDAGAGTGLISLMIAQRCQYARIESVEIDPIASDEASLNILQSPWRGRINAVCTDFLNYIPDAPVDVVISNPPFFSNGVTPVDISRKTARHEAELTIGKLITHSRQILRPLSGRLILVSPADRKADILFEAAMCGFSVARMTFVTTVEGKQPKRILWELSLDPASTYIEEHFAIRLVSGEYSQQYVDLVKDFYLEF